MSDPVVVLAVFEPAEGRAEQLREALAASLPAVHAEQGCELYAIHDGPDGVVYMIEKWTRVADLDEHDSGVAVAALRQAIEGLTTRVQVTRMSPIPAGTEEQGLL